MKEKTENKVKTVMQYNGKSYNIIGSYEDTDIEGLYNYKVYETDEIKNKRFWAWYPLWVGNKFRWFTWVNAQYRFYLYTKEQFEEFNYTFHWSSLKGKWKIEKI